MHCNRPACSGDVEDGYCNVCGMAPVEARPAPPANGTTPSTPVPQTGTVMSSISTRTGSARTGSRRTGSGRTRRGNLGGALLASYLDRRQRSSPANLDRRIPGSQVLQ
jgi:serine/threonine-protein kinase PknG